MSFLIIAVDPGRTTGLAYLEYRGEEWVLIRKEYFEYGDVFRAVVELDGFIESRRALSIIDTREDLDVRLVIEDYVGMGMQSAVAKEAIIIIGRFLMYADFLDIPTALQTPSARKPFIKKASQMVNENSSGSFRHCIAACAHGLHYITRNSLGC